MGNFEIMDYDKFTPSAHGLFKAPFYGLGARAHFECHLNPAKDDEYAPRLTLSKRMRAGSFSIILKIELSLPKLLFGNNFEELSDTDFPRIIEKLCYKLAENGVIVTPDTLKTAQITGIHYGKNIVLTNITTANLIIRTLAKLNISQRLDAGHTDFRNDGHAVRYHTNTYEFTFYDKAKDLAQARISERRALESDNRVQLGLFDVKELRTIEVLRMECRLNTRHSIRTVLGKCGITVQALTFEALFSKNIAQAVLLYFWETFVEPDLGLVLLAEHDIQTTFTKLQISGMKEIDILKCCGALIFIRNHGIRSLRESLGRQSNAFARIKKLLSSIESQQDYLLNCFKLIKQALLSFEQVKLADYQTAM